MQEFYGIGELQKLGINAADVDKLKKANIHTVGMFLATPTKVRA